jgi:hypothetical protein
MFPSGCGTPDKNNPNPALQLLAGTSVPQETVTPAVTGTVTDPTETTHTPTVVPTVSAVPTNPTNPPDTPDSIATHEAFATEVRGFREELGTSVALTHAPTDTPGEPPAYPTATPILGVLPGCSNTNPYGPQAISCWRGAIDGNLVDVDAGREGLAGDQTQGIIKVHVEGQQGEDIYRTPQRVGAVSIVSVTTTLTSTLFTLSTVEQPTPQVFVFDLATRQWVSP